MTEELFAIAWTSEDRPFAVVPAQTKDLKQFMNFLRFGEPTDQMGRLVNIMTTENQYWTIHRGMKVAFMGMAYKEVIFNEGE